MMSMGIMKMGMMRRNDEGDDVRPAMIKSGRQGTDKGAADQGSGAEGRLSISTLAA